METVRPATRADREACISLLDELFSAEKEFSPDRQRQERGLSMLFDDPSTGALLVAETDGRVVGMVLLLFTVSTFLGRRVALLEDMVVAEEFRRRGVASRLVDAAVLEARMHGIARITLLTDADNAAAHALYRSRGFEPSSMMVFRRSLEEEQSEGPDNRAWQCRECGWLYDPSEGDPDNGVAEGTPFSALPPEWCCPVCFQPLTRFEPLP